MGRKRRGHGEGSVYQRKDGRWVAGLTLENHKRKYFYGDTRREVLEALKKAQHEQQQGTLATGPQQTVGAFLDQWLEQAHRHVIRASTYPGYRGILNKHMIPELGHIRLQQLTPQHIQAFYDKKLKEGLSPSTIRRFHAILHRALDTAVQWNLIGRNVSNIVSLPRKGGRRIQPLSEEQAKRLLQAVRGQPLEAMITVALVTGMRMGELLALRWSDVDMETGSVQVSHTINRYGSGGLIESEPKTAAGKRRVLLPPFAVGILKEHRARQATLKAKAGVTWKDNNLVFTNRVGWFIESTNLRTMFRQLLEDAGLPRIRFHDLRHSAATLLLSMGVNVKVIQELLGHSNVSITLQVYSHMLPSMQKEAVDKLEDFFDE